MTIREIDMLGVDQDMLAGLRITRRVRIAMVLGGTLVESLCAALAAQVVVPTDASIAVGICLFVVLVATRRSRDRLNLYVLDDLPSMAMHSLVSVCIAWVLVGGSLSGVQAALAVALACGAMFIARSLIYVVRRRLQGHRRMVRNTLVVGGGEVAAALAESIDTNPSLGLRPIAMLDDLPTDRAVESIIPVRSMTKFEPAYISKRGIDVVIVAFSRIREPDLLAILRTFDKAQCEIYIVPRLFEYASVSGDMDHIRGIPVVRVRRLAHRTLTWRLKRLSSMILSALAICLLSPVLGAVALAVWLNDRSAPVLFRQNRITEGAREFTMLKFRSMKPANDSESQTKWNIANDDRLGRLGRFLRKSSLDELPQLFNVFKGDMALVGPRPERPHFVRQFEQDIPGYQSRHRIKAGLTGWAAIHGLRGDTSLFERAVYDNYYIENWSLWLDLKIMIRTVIFVLRQTGS